MDGREALSPFRKKRIGTFIFMSSFNRIIAHDDFDGLICATICSHALGIEEFQFAGPRTVTEARISITGEDVVCDLPYPLECGMWFDHHEGNLEELKYRDIDPETIRGRFDLKKSCARVVSDYFSEREPLPPHFNDMVDEADVIDSFGYTSVEDWRRETPGKIIDCSLKRESVSVHQKWDYLRYLILLLKQHSLDSVAVRNEVRERYVTYREEEKSMMIQVKQNISFLPEDVYRRLILLDLTQLKRQPHLQKNLAFLLFPEAEVIVEVKNLFRQGTKTNDLCISMSLSLNFQSVAGTKNVGDIMRQLNIGSGHRGAGAGTVHCSSKQEMLNRKEKILGQILKLYQGQ